VNGLTGTGSLVRLALRRDRFLLPAWMLLFAGMAGLSATATIDLYPDLDSRVQAAAAVNGTPALVAMYGRVWDPTSLGAVSLIKMSGLGAALLAVLAFMLVVRHSRAEEEAGRLELLGAGAQGRLAAPAAALTVSVGAMLVVGLTTALALSAAGLPAAGSWAFGAAWAATGSAFAAVGVLCAQLSTSARAANGLAAVTLAATYLVRAAGDVTGPGGAGWLSWLSPVGWGQQVRPFAGDRWAVLVAPVLFAGVVAAGALVLASRRDLGAGLLPDRPGPAHGARWLGTPLGLAWRLQRGGLLAWLSGVAVLGLVVGDIATQVGTFFTSDAARQLLTQLGGRAGVTDAFLALELAFTGIVVSAYGIQAALRLHAEESSLRAEPVLATGVPRLAWAGAHVLVAVLGSTAMLATAGLAAGVGYAAQTGDAGQVPRVLGAALVQLPAAWVLTGVVVALFGLAPRLVTLAWGALVVVLLVGELGPLFRAPGWVLDLSPFTHLPHLPGGQLSAAPLLWLTVVAVALAVAGFAGLRRRDVG